ncbi:unnamed protein product, partial [Effrenium voratum]
HHFQPVMRHARHAFCHRDFQHHAAGLARLNHASFGSPPLPVQKVQQRMRDACLAAPDALFFSGELQQSVARAAESAAPLINAEADQVCLMENATVAAMTVFNRWMWGLLKRVCTGNSVLVLSTVYQANLFALRATCERAGAGVIVVEAPFPTADKEEVLSALRRALKEHRIRYAYLDHVSSQPALELPIREMVRLCHEHGVEEVCVDGAHTIGSADYDVEDVGAEWFFSNLHKWAFAPSTATLLHGKKELLENTSHAVVSWNWGQGLRRESQFPGSRDYSAFLAVPAAVDYLRTWRSALGEDSQSFCRRRVREAARELQEAWGTEPAVPDDMVATQAMVQLPVDLKVLDQPGVPGQGLRSLLRERFQVEAAVGNFGAKGNFVRLSYAVYNTQEDIHRLRDAVDVLLREQRKGPGP